MPGTTLHNRFLLIVMLFLVSPVSAQETFDIVISNGRVMDPETGLDAIRNVGIRGQSVVAISEQPLTGATEVDATGLVVAPGFVDLHAHGQSARANEFQAMDGVTTALELEGGVPDLPGFLASRAGNAVINYGASISHGDLRVWSMSEHAKEIDRLVSRIEQSGGQDDAAYEAIVDIMGVGAYQEMDPADYPGLWARLEKGLNDGALGIGMPHQYYPGVSRDEIFRLFQFAADKDSIIFTHVREMGVSGMQEVVANAIATGAPLHIVHLNSMSLGHYQTNLDLILGAQERGADVTTEAYPYTAASTGIQSAIFDDGWQERLSISYGDVQWQDTGERLTEETFNAYREEGGVVIIHLMKEEWIKAQLSDPRVMIASDGMPYAPGAHPRGAGTFSRFLGHYVRDQEVISLMGGLAKMTLQPAERLEAISPQMKRKGRVQIGSDADITIFSAETVIDTAGFEGELTYSEGVQYVIVNGEFVVWDGELVEGARPGQAILGRNVVF
ncbi:MAG: amidohydrolase family protein [Woeseiaceae bacterium]